MKIEIEEPIPVPTTLAFTALRIVAGVILTAHGLLKLHDLAAWQGQVEKLAIPLPEIAAPLAMAAELLGGFGLVLGLFTRLSALASVCVMATAIATVHARGGLLTRDGGFEFPLLLGSCAALFAVLGGGRLSLDHFQRVRARLRAIAMDRRWGYPPYVPGPNSEPPAYGGRNPSPDARGEYNPGYRG